MLRENRVPGQVDFGSDVERRVEVAAGLVNALAITHANGRPVDLAADVRARADVVLRRAGDREGPALSTAEGAEFVALAARLREVFTALAQRRDDEAAQILNALLAESGARPELQRDARLSWTLHFHPADTGVVNGWTAGCAFGLAYVVGAGQARRLGTCTAPVCERVFLDLSRNGSRRFCSTACQNRVKAAAYRARQQV